MVLNTKTLSFHLLVTLILSSVSLSHDCSDNCFSCLRKDYCTQCYKRRVVGAVYPVEGGQCSSEPTPASDHCLVYSSNSCARCEPGWATPMGGGLTTPCVRGNIQNCLDEWLEYGQHQCYRCLGGYPSKDLTKCIPADLVKAAIPHCMVGVTDSATGSHACAECVPGYLSEVGRCVRMPANSNGCLRMYKGRCQLCDAKNGYFLRDEHTCSKNGSA